MAQYLTFADGSYSVFNDTTSTQKVRVGQRDSAVVYDGTLSALGFAGTEDVDWRNIGGYEDEITGSLCRMGVRDGNWVIDIELTATGFSGSEDTDWAYLGGIDII